MSDRPRILVVDDEPAVQQALSRAFALERYEVELAGDGVEAFDALAASRFDAVVLDVMMPGCRGSKCASGCARVATAARS